MGLAGSRMLVEVPPELLAPEPVVWRDRSRAVVALLGEHDLSTASTVAGALAHAAALGDGDVVVDLSGVTFMDAAIVAVLLTGRENLRSRARSLTVRAPSRQARFVLGMCGLAGLIDLGPGPRRVGTRTTASGSA